MYVIFGCGHLGRVAVSGLRSCGIEPLAYCDNNKDLWGSTQDGLRVLSPLEARNEHRNDQFVVAIYNPSRVTQQLHELGLASFPYMGLYRRHRFAEETRFNLSVAPNVTTLLADDYSVDEYLAQRYWQASFDSSTLRLHSDPKDIYFPKHIYQIGQDEVFVDCGAFDGDTYSQFVEAVDGKYKQAYLIEPDPRNVVNMHSLFTGGGGVKIIPSAVGNHCGKVTFDSAGTAGSSITDTGGIEVDCTTLDALFADSDVAPTIIKMDVEGHELKALEGAKETIRKHQPVLAVCAYHTADHLWQIPQLIHHLNPDYKIYLRRYAEDCWETVYYAVPPDRVAL